MRNRVFLTDNFGGGETPFPIATPEAALFATTPQHPLTLALTPPPFPNLHHPGPCVQNKRSPLSFRLGLREVVPGMDKGLMGMRVGGSREITVPASMGYGDKGAGPIPPGSDLTFHVELIGVI